jgi:hypothetical protein
MESYADHALWGSTENDNVSFQVIHSCNKTAVDVKSGREIQLNSLLYKDILRDSWFFLQHLANAKLINKRLLAAVGMVP